MKNFLQLKGAILLTFFLGGNIIFPSPFLNYKSLLPQTSPLPSSSTTLEMKILHHLRCIYNEVKEMGPYEGENFIKREFFIEIDGRQENKEEQVVVLIYPVHKLDRMLIQVTSFSSPRLQFIRLAESTKKISCAFFNNDLALTSSDYNQKETEYFLKAILKGIREEKKLLSLIKKKLNY